VTLRYAVLVVSVDATELYSLFLMRTAVSEVFSGKDTIIGVVAFDASIVLRSQLFKRVFSCEGFFGSG
jgi:hypothetical protein